MAQAQGVNVVGFFRAEFGQGEAARRVLLALRQAEVPFSAITYDRVPHRQEHPFEANGTAEYPTNIVCLNAEHLLQFVQDGGAELLRSRSSAGLWFWEASRFPPELRQALDFLDEIWVASDFVARDDRGRDGQAGADLPAARDRAGAQRLSRAATSASRTTVRLPVRLRLLQHARAQEPARPDRGVHARLPRARRGRSSTSRASTATARPTTCARRARRRSATGPDIVLSDGYVGGERLTALTAALRLLRLAPPQRGLRPDDRGGDGARQAGDRHRLLGQPRLHGRGDELPRPVLADRARAGGRAVSGRERSGPSPTSTRRRS